MFVIFFVIGSTFFIPNWLYLYPAAKKKENVNIFCKNFTQLKNYHYLSGKFRGIERKIKN